jgi:phosphomannomutase
MTHRTTKAEPIGWRQEFPFARRSMSRPAAAVNHVIKAYDVRGLVGEEIDERFVADVGGAFARLVRDGDQPGVSGAGGPPACGGERSDSGNASSVAIGYDMRASSPSLAAAFAQGVVAQGLNVTRIGLASTDQLYFASGLLDCPGAMFTASHNPAAYNGIKLCRAGAKPVGKDTGLTTISHEVINGVPGFDGEPGTITDRDVLGEYGDFLRSLVDIAGLRPLRVAVDAGNGMGGHTTPAVLGALKSITLLPLFFELDGTFPNHEANPLDPANLVDLQRHVVETRADIGLAFDGDADRCFVVDELGHSVSPSAVTALVAGRELGREIGASVIHNLITSRAVPELITERGGTAIRSRVGHSYIKALMAESGAIFGGEHSAHYYFRDFWGADSGMLAALHVLAALGEQDRPLSQMMADYQRYAASGEINFTVVDAPACVDAVLKSLAGRIQSIDHLDGVTVDLGDGSWFNLRTSNTEPLLRLNVEARSSEEVAAIVDHVATQIASVSETVT